MLTYPSIMQLREQYTDINRTMEMLMCQVYESIPFAAKVCPAMESPEQIFRWLKNQLIYRNDPPGIELLQAYHTMMENNYHGISGAGDCDCFTIAAISCLKVNGFDDVAIILRGRNTETPVHIYPAVWDGKGWVAFDLTNTFYGQERPYTYKQILPI